MRHQHVNGEIHARDGRDISGCDPEPVHARVDMQRAGATRASLRPKGGVIE